MNIFQRPIFRVMCAGLLASAIVGCGNKGPLVLPAKPVVAEPAGIPVEGPDANDAVDAVEPAGPQDEPAAADDPAPVR